MEVNHHIIFGSLLYHSLIEVHHPLVATVHEVYLHARYTPLGITLEEVHVVLYSEPRQPQNESHVAALAVSHEFGDVDGVDGIERVARRACPSLVKDDVRYAELGGEVDVILVRVVVDASLEIHAPNHLMVPPVPAHLTRLYPAAVLQLARRGQHVGHLVGKDVPVLSGDDEVTPRERTPALRAGDIVSLLQNLLAAVSVLTELKRNLREHRAHTVLARALEEHARIVSEVSLGYENLIVLVRTHKHGEVYHLVRRLEVACLQMAVRTFIRSLEAVSERHMRRIVARETYLERLARNVCRSLYVCHEAVCHSVVESPELHRIIARHAQSHCVVMVFHHGVLYRHLTLQVFVHRSASHFLQLRLHAHLPAAHVHRHLAVCEHRVSVDAYRVGHSVAQRDAHLHSAVGRFQCQVVCRSHARNEQCRRKQKDCFLHDCKSFYLLYGINFHLKIAEPVIKKRRGGKRYVFPTPPILFSIPYITSFSCSLPAL